MSTTIRTNPTSKSDSFSAADWLFLLFPAVVWGSSFLLIAEALEAFTPGMVTLGRVGGGAVTLWVIRAVSSKKVPRIEREDYGKMVLLSFLWVALPFTLFPIAQQQVNSAVTGLLNGSTPIFVAVLGVVFYGKSTRLNQVFGIGLGFLGVAVISFSSVSTDGENRPLGMLLIVAATVCYGFSLNIVVPFQKKYGAISLMSAVTGLAALWVAPLGLYQFGENSWSVDAFAATVFLGVAGTGLAFWVMSGLIGRVGPVPASFVTYIVPVISLTLGVTLRNDTVVPIAVVGAAATIAGALIAARRDSS